jgi:uncharacterized membrane protein
MYSKAYIKILIHILPKGFLLYILYNSIESVEKISVLRSIRFDISKLLLFLSYNLYYYQTSKNYEHEKT